MNSLPPRTSDRPDCVAAAVSVVSAAPAVAEPADRGGSSPQPRQPAPLEPPPARRQASAREIETMRRFHLGVPAPEPSGQEGSLTVGLWSWLLTSASASSASASASSASASASASAASLAAAEPGERDRGGTAAPDVATASRATAPVSETTVPRDVALPLTLLWARLIRRGREARPAWLGEARRLRRGLRALLERHAAPDDGNRVELERRGLGDLGSRFVDAAALASSLRPASGTLPAERRRRVERALERLEGLERSDASAAASGLLVCESSLAHRFGVGSLARSLGEGSEPPRVELDDEPCGYLAQAFDQRAREIAADLAALRIARLELDEAFEPERHDAALAAFDWQAFHREELPLLPPMIALLGADSVAGASLGPLFRLLLSGRPVQVVVLVDPASSPGAGFGLAGNGYRFEPGLIAMGLRRAIVHQGSVAFPRALERAFARAAGAPCSSLHVLATPSLSAPALGSPCAPAAEARVLDQLAVTSHAHPAFLFEPADTGAPQRLLLGHEPGTDDAGGAIAEAGDGASEGLGLARLTLAPLDPESHARAELETTCTFGDYALACGCFADDFLAVDDDLDHDGLIPLADWLAKPERETHELVPFVWAIEAEEGERGERAHRLRRLATTRRLALCAQDRLESWRTLERLAAREPAGADASPVAEHEEQAHAVSVAEPEAHGLSAPLPQAPAKALDEQRRAMAQEIVTKLVAALVGSSAQTDRPS